MTTTDPDKAAATVAKWLADPEASASASIGAALMAGEWTTTDDVRAMGVNGSNLSQVVAILNTAGYAVAAKSVGGLSKAWRVTPGRDRRPSPEAVPERAKASGMIHPPVGARVIVRAVAMGARGVLTVHLSDGNGNAWTANVTGYVESEGDE